MEGDVMTEQPTTTVRGEEASAQALVDGMRPAQRARYLRIVAAAKELAEEGGYDAVQMRAVADRSGVALGTVYRYFPSKNHLLVVALVLDFETAGRRFVETEIPGATAPERIMTVLRASASALEERPRLYDALVRASMFADASSAAELDRLGRVLTDLFAHAAGIDVVTERVLNAVHIIADVWMSSLVMWAGGRETTEGVLAHMETTVRLVFDRLEGLQRAS